MPAPAAASSGALMGGTPLDHTSLDAPLVRWLPRPAPFEPVWHAMRAFTHARTTDTRDEIWLVEHTPVYTLGQAGRHEHLLNPNAHVPIVQTDRGGQITFHGPGQLVAYGLIDLRRRGLYVRDYVALLEDSVLDLLHEQGLACACRIKGAPGIYLPVRTHGPSSATPYAQSAATPDLTLMDNMAKIAALGIKVSKGCAYHGLALNVHMDLCPFTRINPCGYPGLHTTDLRRQGITLTLDEAAQALLRHWLPKLPGFLQR